MTKFFKQVCLVTALGAGVAGCSTIEEINEVRAFAQSAQEVNAQRTRVLGDPIVGRAPLAGTSFDAVPTSGSATYLGATFLTVQDMRGGDRGFALVGDTQAIVDFGKPDDAVSGSIDNFRQIRSDEISTPVAGALTLRTGQLGAEQPNSLTAAFDGGVTVADTEYRIDGLMEGRLRGTRTAPGPDESVVRAISLVDSNATVQGGGGDLNAIVTMIGEN